MTWATWADDELGVVRSQGRWRQPRAFDARGPKGELASAEASGRQVVSFASNDYLGLSHHPAVLAAAHVATDRWGTGAGSARLIVGSRPVHHDLEEALARWKGTDRAVLFPTGFAANVGVLGTFGGEGVTVCSDVRNHASIIDGCRAARARVEVFGHNDVEHLERLLAEADRAMVVTESVFSMDGDTADLEAIAALCTDAGALLVLDEAHAVFGPDFEPPSGCEVIRVGTLSKTLGSLGGFVACSAAFADLLVNRSRPYIFTTALPPAAAAAAYAALEVWRSPEGDVLVDRVRAHAGRLRPGASSPIIPIVVGSESAALDAAAALLAEGILVPAIRPPTVPDGSCRLRVAVSAAHTDGDIELLDTALAGLGFTDE